MPYANTPNEAEARQRLRAFWNNDKLDRPACLIQVRNPHYQPTKSPFEHLSPKERDLIPEFHVWQATEARNAVIHMAESMPGFHNNWGSLLCTLPYLAGGDYEYHDSAWIKPIENLYDRPLPVFDPKSKRNQEIEACYRAMAEVVRGYGFITPPLMLDGLTTLSMFRETHELSIDLIERPDDVIAWSRALTRMYCEIYEYYWQLLQQLGVGGESLCFFGPMCEGRSEGVQCDFAVNLSPEMFERFVLPDLRTTTDYMDRSLYHHDGVCQRRFHDLLQRCPKLSGIQWNPEVPERDPLKWLDTLKDIRRRGFRLYVWASPEVAVELTRQLGPDGLFLSIGGMESREAAEKTIRALESAARTYRAPL
jgi:hypothetical protein